MLYINKSELMYGELKTHDYLKMKQSYYEFCNFNVKDC